MPAPAAPLSLTRRAALGGAGAAALSACAPLTTLQTATVAPALFRLSPKSTYPDDLPKVRAQIVVDEPTAGASVNTDRIAIRPHPLKVEYFPEARWVDRAPLMVQSLLLESFENADEGLSVGRRATGIAADYTLLTDLREFQAEALTPSPEGADDKAPVQVHVRLNFKLVVEPQGEIVASRTFARRSGSEISDSMISSISVRVSPLLRPTIVWSDSSSVLPIVAKTVMTIRLRSLRLSCGRAQTSPMTTSTA